MTTTGKVFVLTLLAVLPSITYADQGSFTNSGGSTSVSSGVTISSTVAAPAGALTLHCPAVSPSACAGGSFSFLSTDGTTTISATFISGTFRESCSSGRFRPTVCSWSFTGQISGTLTVNGVAQAIIGGTQQSFGVNGAAAHGTTFYNSSYSPFYYSDSEQILRSDNLTGTNQISFGSQGSDVGQFYGAYGIALDSAGRIYVADTYNCRIVRIDDMNGTNWTSFGDGICASGQGEFNDPFGIAVDSAGKIYVMDTGNSRLVSIDDMTGTNWTTFGSVGSGVGQFSTFSSVTVDSSGRIYVPDTGNARLVRMDDMNGTNWTELRQSVPVNGVSYYSFQSPAAISLDPAGRIYVADNQSYRATIVRVDDMTGANWTSFYTGTNSVLNSVSVDSSGSVFAGGGGVRIVDNMAGVLNSSGSIAPFGSYYVFGVTAIPVPSPRPSALSFSPSALTFSVQDIGSSSSPQSVTITNFGGSPLNFSGISSTDQFAQTNNCPNSLVAGASCTANVSFVPTASGPVTGLLSLNDDSGNLGTAQAITLTGTGSMPRLLSVSPTTLNFSGYTIGDNPRQTVTVTNTSGTPVGIAGIDMSGDPSLTQSNNCPSVLAAGTTCAVTVTFTPAAYGTFTSTLIVTQSSGAQETASVTGTAFPDD